MQYIGGHGIVRSRDIEAIRSNRLKVEKKEKRSLQIIVVNPDESVETTFRRLVGPNVTFIFHQATFENFVAGAQSGDE